MSSLNMWDQNSNIVSDTCVRGNEYDVLIVW